MWFSVVMWDGMAGDIVAAKPSSCTFRSKIWEDAGDGILGDRDCD